MAHKLRFVVAAMQEVPWLEMVKRWQYLETCGIDGAMLAAHFVNFASPNVPCFVSWAMLAALVTRQRLCE